MQELTDVGSSREFANVVDTLMTDVETARKAKNEIDTMARGGGFLTKSEERAKITRAINAAAEQTRTKGGTFESLTEQAKQLRDEERRVLMGEPAKAPSGKVAQFRRQLSERLGGSLDLTDVAAMGGQVRTARSLRADAVYEAERDAVKTLKEFVGVNFEAGRKVITALEGRRGDEADDRCQRHDDR